MGQERAGWIILLYFKIAPPHDPKEILQRKNIRADDASINYLLTHFDSLSGHRHFMFPSSHSHPCLHKRIVSPLLPTHMGIL